MSHTIDQTSLIKGFFMKETLEICSHRILIFPVLDFLLHILEHLDNLDVGTAVLWSFEGTK